VVTSGHVKKLTVTPFDPPYQKTHAIHANLMAACFTEPDYCRITLRE